MKRIISFLLSLIVLMSSVSFVVFADEDSAGDSGAVAPEVSAIGDVAGLGTAFATGESKNNPASNMNDDKLDTAWTISGDDFGINYTKEANVKIYSISVLLTGAEGTYKLQYFRNNRWVDEATLTNEDFVPVEGVENQYRLDYAFEEPVITQQIRIIYSSGAISNLTVLKVYDIDVMGIYLPNVGTKGEAYASSFKHFDWTPPHTFNDGHDFEDDWHGWEPQYPDVAAGSNTSEGFSGEYVGIKFVNREYYKINQITFYMSMHNSSAMPEMGYQDTKYTVEALVEGEWIVIAEFKDSDSLPKSYKDYDDAMANDKSDYHIHSYYTITLDEKVNTNNVRVTVSEFAKNYDGADRLIFPYIFEMRVYAEEGEIPDIELPEGAVLSTNAAANSFPYASSSATNLYPFLAIDGDVRSGWQTKDLSAGQIFGTRFDKIYTIDSFTLELGAADFSAPFKLEAKVNGEWVKLADGNASDCYVELPEGKDFIAQSHTYEFAPVETDEIRIVFTEALTKAVQVNEIYANIISSMTYLVDGGVTVTPAANEAGRYCAFNLNQKAVITKIKVSFAAAEKDNKFFIQSFANGIWQTVFTGDNVKTTDGIFEINAETDAIRIIYQDENAAPQINSFDVTVVNYSGDVSSFTTFSVPCTDKAASTVVDIAYGKTYNIDKVVIDHAKATEDLPFKVMALVGEEWRELVSSTVNADKTSFLIDETEVKQVKVIYEANGKEIPSIESLALNVVGMKTYFLDGRYTNFQKRMAGNGDIAVLGTAYSNSNYPALCFPEYINDGKKFEGAPVWAPKLEEYSAGIDIYCGVELDKEYIVDTVVVYSTDIGNKPGNGNKFEIQALVNGEYITVGNGFTCAGDKDYMTVYAIDSVKTTDIRILITNESVYMPTILELEIYSGTDKVDPFYGHVVSEKVPEVTVFNEETPRFEVAGLPN